MNEANSATRCERRASRIIPALGSLARSFRCARPFVIVAALLGVIVLGAAGDDLEGARATLEKWVETRRVISQEKLEWARGRETLKDRIALVEREIGALRTSIEKTRNDVATAEADGVSLHAENDLLKSASTSLREQLVGLEERTRALLARVPEPIRVRVKPLSQRLPENSQESQLSMGERFQNVIGVLNEINKFNGEVTLASEVRELPDGSSVEVTALYIGIAHGFYVNATGTIAGVGSGSGTGWTWTPANESADRIAGAIAILKNEKAASFVKLPLRID